MKTDVPDGTQPDPEESPRYAPPAAAVQAADAPARPRLLPAFVLGFLVPGAGHVYAGAGWRTLRALAIAGAGLAVVLLLPGRPLLALAAGALTPLAVALDAAREARRPGAARPPRGWVAVAFAGLAVLTVGMRVGGRELVSEPYQIPARSMAPVLLPGDSILVDKRAYRSRPPERGDIIVFRYPDDRRVEYVKRIVGIPGDEVRISRRTVTLNGVPLPHAALGEYVLENDWGGDPLFELGAESLPGGRSYHVLHRPADPSRSTFQAGTWTVPKDGYFVLGDNRDNSRDSARWENPFVPREDVVGRVVSRYWSTDPRTGLPRLERIGPIGAGPSHAGGAESSGDSG